MKPLYKFKKEKKKISFPPPTPLPSYKARTLPLTKVEMIRTAYPLQGAQHCTDLKEDPCHPQPQDEALWVGQPAWWGGDQKTALIVLISQDNKTTSVLQPKHFLKLRLFIFRFPSLQQSNFPSGFYSSKRPLSCWELAKGTENQSIAAAPGALQWSVYR